MNGVVRGLVLGAACLAGAGAAAAGDRAVLVGIDSYPGVFLPRLLTGAAADAERMRDHLVADLGFAPEAVTLLTNEAASSGAIVDALIENLVTGTGPGDRAFFYFAGLGGRIADDGGTERASREEFLLAHGDGDPFALIPEEALVEIFDRIGDRDVTMVIDASMTAPRVSLLRRGDTTAARAAAFGQLPAAITRAAGGGGVAPGDAAGRDRPFGTGTAARDVWLAAAPAQVAWETPEGGVFTRAWLDGLSRGAADRDGNGTVTNAELLVHLRAASEGWCGGNPSCTATGLGLTPDFSGDPLGRMAVLAPSSAAPGTPAGREPLAAVTEVPGRDTVRAYVTDLFAASNAARLEIGISADGPLRLGQTVRFTVTSARPGTLLLLDVNPEGELFRIFPSRLSVARAAEMSAGETITIPGPVANTGRPMQITVTEPAGDGLLIALLVESDASVLDDILPRSLELAPVPNATQYLYELVRSLLEMQVGPDGNPGVAWSAAYLPYTIVR